MKLHLFVFLLLHPVFCILGLQFACSVAPNSMKGIIMGLFYFFSGVGSFLGTVIIMVLNNTGIWFHHFDSGNINCREQCDLEPTHKGDCHLDYFFYFLAIVEVVGFLLFVLVAKMLHLEGSSERPQFLRTESLRYPSAPARNGRGLMDGLN